MKKLVLSLAVVALTLTGAMAQSTFGAKGGFNSTSIRASADGVSASESASGFYFGVFGEFSLSEKVALQPELQYVAVSEDGGDSSFLNIPIFVDFKVADKFSIEAGPQIDILLDDEEEAQGLKRVGFGLGAGASFDITENLFIDARYVLGLSNRLEDNEFGGDVDVKFNYIQAGLGYRF